MKAILRSISFSLCLLAGIGCGPALPSDPEILARLPEKVDFNYHIKPLLSDRCYACHGPDAHTREAGLRLDEQDAAFQTNPESGHRAIVPGSLRRSAVIERIFSTDPEAMMPPPEANLSLSDYEKALIARWIEQGAAWTPHWAFIPPTRPALPQVRESAWIRHPIDHFVLAQIEQKGISPTPEADRERLLRRVTLDLTGLPPTLNEIDAFLADSAPDAYEKVVDRLLHTEAYAERMSMDWMDVARYADSHGMHADGWRSMWPWRDWVIRAFRENMPYDQFATWQLAGDLLPNASKEQILATAFHRNHPMTAEGGVVDEEFRLEYVFDRTATTATAFMGLTLECARCHDHKFDPISQEEFYQFSAFFNNVKELGMTGDDGNYGPMLVMLEDDQEAKLKEIDHQIDQKEADLRLSREAVLAAKDFVESLQQQPIDLEKGLQIHLPMDRIEQRKNNKGQNQQLVDGKKAATTTEGAELVPGKSGQALRLDSEFEVVKIDHAGLFEMNEAFSAGLWIYLEKENEIQTLMGNAGNKNNFWRGWNFELDSAAHLSVKLIHSLPHNYLHVLSDATIPKETWTHVFFTYDGSGKAAGLQVYINGLSASSSVKFDRLTRTIFPIEAGANERVDRPLQLGKSYRAFTGENGVYKGRLDELRVYSRALSALEVAKLAGAELAPSASMAGLDERGRALIADQHFRQNDLPHQRLLRELKALRGERMAIFDDALEVMVMEEMPQPRTTFLLNRGQYDAPTRAVAVATPRHVLPFPEELAKNRLGLAKWLFSPEHPLTARVTVNRYWQMYFGKGIVSTPQDFGNQGVLPTHPALLDWLAIEFRESGWDVRALQKSIVMSATYRQDSRCSPELLQADPGNELLARGPKHRLSAEMIRDNALAASGLLVRQVGGPSVKPYQPPGLWIDKGSFSHKLLYYVPDKGEGLYRRTLYTFIRRTSPPPAMAIFDAPERSTCTVHRAATNTPMQALVLLNDPQYVEAARFLAERMILEEGEGASDQIRRGFRLATGVRPDPKMLAVLVQQYEEAQVRFQQDAAAARALLATGEKPRNTQIPLATAAAMTVVASTILNYDATYTKR